MQMKLLFRHDGVVVKKGSKQAVYLPQVATETGWSKEEFLDPLCYKAGLREQVIGRMPNYSHSKRMYLVNLNFS